MFQQMNRGDGIGGIRGDAVEMAYIRNEIDAGIALEIDIYPAVPMQRSASEVIRDRIMLFHADATILGAYFALTAD